MTQKITPTLTLYDSTIERIEAEAKRRGISPDDLMGELLTVGAAGLVDAPSAKTAAGNQAFYTPAEAAALLRVKPATVTEHCRSGRIKATKAGTRWRIPAEALEAYLNQN